MKSLVLMVHIWVLFGLMFPLVHAENHVLSLDGDGDATRLVAELPERVPSVCTLSGIARYDTGEPVQAARVWLEQDHTVIAQIQTGQDGNYRLVVAKPGIYDLFAVADTKGDLMQALRLRDGETRLNLTLGPAISIEGTTHTTDGRTPHTSLVVQAVVDGQEGSDQPQLVATVLTNEWGEYQFINLKPGTYKVRCYASGRYAYYQPRSHGTSDVLTVERHRTLSGIDFILPRFKKGTWRSYTNYDGLATPYVKAVEQSSDGFLCVGTDAGGIAFFDGQMFHNPGLPPGARTSEVLNLHLGTDGVMWIGTLGGVVRYDGHGFTTLTPDDGLPHGYVEAIHQDSSGMLWFGTQEGLSRYDGRRLSNFTTADGLAENRIRAIYEDQAGVLWFGTSGGISRYEGGAFESLGVAQGVYVNAVCGDSTGVLWFGTGQGVLRYDGHEFQWLTQRDGLLSDWVITVHCDQEGVLWFGTSAGVSRYDGQGFTNFTQHDGLVSNYVGAIHSDSDGVLWFGTGDTLQSSTGGLSRYDARHIETFTSQDGLPTDHVEAIERTSDGSLWFGSLAGLCRRDGDGFTIFTTADGLPSDSIMRLHTDANGKLWIGTRAGHISSYDGQRFVNPPVQADSWVTDITTDAHAVWFGTLNDGVFRHDGQRLTHFEIEDGLPDNTFFRVYQDMDGMMWFGGTGGVCYYDGQTFATLEMPDVPDHVFDIKHDDSGMLWIGTYGDGLYGYDGKSWRQLTRENGLASDYVFRLEFDAAGNPWIGTDGSGVCWSDGTAWTTLDTRDGLVGDRIIAVHHDVESAVWMGSHRGVSVYRRSATPPQVRILSVQTNQVHEAATAVPTVHRGSRVTFRYASIDLKTLPSKRQYRWRIRERDDDWRRPTKSDTADFIPPEPGTYTFEVQAIDRDLNYSEPASVVLTAVNPFYLRAAFLIPTLGGGSVLIVALAIVSVAAIRRRRQVHAYERYAAQEIADARAMQLSLLPEHAPAIEGAEITGRCVTANTVGGDFFAYLPGTHDQQVGLVVADVSGKAMRGAMNAVLADGILSRAVDDTGILSPSLLMTKVNDTLTARMESDMNVTMVIGLLDTRTMMLTLANSAHHAYPLLVRDGQVTKLKARGLPLGMRAGVQYREETFELQPGGVLVLMTDGIIEAHDADGNMYSESGRLEQALTGFTALTSAEAMVDAVISDAIEFSNNQREDDMTLVVVKLGDVA